MDILQWLGTTEVRRGYIQAPTVINLTKLTHRPTEITTSTPMFTFWVGHIVAQATSMVLGRPGVENRNRWVFWAPILVNNQEGDVFFEVYNIVAGPIWRYSLFFSSKDKRLQERLRRCVFVARGVEAPFDSEGEGTPIPDRRGNLHITSFHILTSASSAYTLDLRDAPPSA